MATCPAGHNSGSDDYCDVCGTRISGSAPVSTPASAPSSAPAPPPGASATGESCPDCSAPRTGRFCEGCGYDFAVGAGRPTSAPTSAPAAEPTSAPTSPPSTPATTSWPGRSAEPATGPMRLNSPASSDGPPWTAVVVADRDYFESVLEQSEDGAAFTFPPYCPERRIPMDRPQIRIGRRSVSQGVVPEIDLGQPPEDPGASHTHAVLLAKPDGTWTLVDPGSTNGTTVNGGDEPIPVNIEVPMRDGDRIHIGVWTTITLQRG
jgi:hypothetical protein